MLRKALLTALALVVGVAFGYGLSRTHALRTAYAQEAGQILVKAMAEPSRMCSRLPVSFSH